MYVTEKRRLAGAGLRLNRLTLQLLTYHTYVEVDMFPSTGISSVSILIDSQNIIILALGFKDIAKERILSVMKIVCLSSYSYHLYHFKLQSLISGLDSSQRSSPCRLQEYGIMPLSRQILTIL